MAIQNDVQNAELAYLLFPFEQYSNLNGKPLVGGHIEVYEAGTSNKYITYQDWNGNSNPFKISIPEDGRIVALADPSLEYDVYVYDSFNNLVCSRLNVQCNVPGTINLSGADTRIKNTDGTLDISLQTIGNNVREYTVNTRNKTLDVQEPLYFVENSESATIIGCRSQSGDYATTAYVESAISGKLDISSYSSQSGNFLTDKFEYDNSNHITAYNNSAFAGTEYEAGDNIDITNHIISVTGVPTNSDIENAISSAVTNVENKFEYNDNNYITAYNNSAFAGKEYSAGVYVSIENDTINVTGLQPSGDYVTQDEMTAYQPSGDYATKTELESATSGKMDVTGMTAYQPSGDYATHDDLTAYQPSGDYATKEDVESATSGKQDTLSAGDGISIINNTISVTAQGGIEQVSHDDTLSGNGNSEPLGIANIEDFVKQDDLTAYQEKGDYYSASNPSGFITNDALTGLQPSGDYVTHDEMTAYQPTGDYATHDDLTAYATTALVSSISSELYSAVSSISGDFELVAGEGVELVDDPNAKTTTINVTAEGTPVTAIEQMIESATSGLQPSGDYATTAQVADKLDTTAFSTVSGDFLTAHQDISDLMSKSESANFYPMTGNPSGFLTAHQDLSNYATTASVADKLDTTSFSTVSSNFLTAVPAGTMNESAFGYDASNNITAYNGSAFAGQGGVTGDYVSGVNVVTSAHAYIPEAYSFTATTVSGDVAVTTAEVMFGYTGHSAAYSLTAIGNAVNGKLDSNYLTDSTTIKNINSHAEMMGSAYRQSGFNTVSADGITITDYSTIISFPHDNTLYSGIITVETTSTGSMPNGWTLQSFDNNSAVLVKQYPLGVTSDVVGFEYGWSITNCEASATTYNGFELAKLAFKDEVPSGGGDVPEGVMVESGLEYNAVNEISAYNGSAIAQYGAEKQWLVHDDTLVHAANSAQYALGVAIDNVARLLGVDETVLFDGTDSTATYITDTEISLNENITNFNRVRIEYRHSFGQGGNYGNIWGEVESDIKNENFSLAVSPVCNKDAWQFENCMFGFNLSTPNKLNVLSNGNRISLMISDRSLVVSTGRNVKNIKVIGIGRKEV